MCANGSFVAAVCSLLDIPIPLTTWHHLLRDVTMCECCQRDSSNIFLVGNIVLFSFSFELSDTRLLFCEFRFHVSIMHIAGAVLIHGSQYYFTPHLIITIPAGTFYARISSSGQFEYLVKDIVLFSFSFEHSGHASPLVRLNFVFMDFSVA